MENQHRLIAGNRELTEKEIDRINKIKALSQACGEIIDEMFEEGDDTRSASIAKKELQSGFMWAVRAVEKPVGF